MAYINTVEYYLAIKKNEILSYKERAREHVSKSGTVKGN
jgi:hypothetical protein